MSSTKKTNQIGIFFQVGFFYKMRRAVSLKTTVQFPQVLGKCTCVDGKKMLRQKLLKK